MAGNDRMMRIEGREREQEEKHKEVGQLERGSGVFSSKRMIM